MERKVLEFKEDQVLLKIEENILASVVDKEMVIMNTKTGEYFGLDEVSATIWNIIDGSKSMDDIISELMEMYEVDEKTCRKDTKPLLVKLLNLKFLKFKD